MHDQSQLNSYFSNSWNPGNLQETDSLSSPTQIAKLISDDEFLLDVGCGRNPFKGLVKNVIGIDPAFKEADYKCSIEEFTPIKSYDVATCLGSINFGTIETIALQIDKVVSCLKQKSRIYWRLNPGLYDHLNEECKDIPFFPWTFELLQGFANKYGYQQRNENTTSRNGRTRLYAEWHRTK